MTTADFMSELTSNEHFALPTLDVFNKVVSKYDSIIGKISLNYQRIGYNYTFVSPTLLNNLVRMKQLRSSDFGDLCRFGQTILYDGRHNNQRHVFREIRHMANARGNCTNKLSKAIRRLAAEGRGPIVILNQGFAKVDLTLEHCQLVEALLIAGHMTNRTDSYCNIDYGVVPEVFADAFNGEELYVLMMHFLRMQMNEVLLKQSKELPIDVTNTDYK